MLKALFILTKKMKPIFQKKKQQQNYFKKKKKQKSKFITKPRNLELIPQNRYRNIKQINYICSVFNT